MPFLFATAVFLSAALMFLIQPMIARKVLPLFGGGPAVWTTCMLFFQAALLAGYLYAHVVCGRLAIRRQIIVHLALLLAGAAALPANAMSDQAPPDEANPILTLLLTVGAAVGLPFFVLSASAPLLQRWYAGATGRDPYGLYAFSNAGSMLGLLSYPLVAEPLLTLREQTAAWAIGYAVLFALIGGCAASAWATTGGGTAGPGKVASDPAPATGWRRRVAWIVLALIPSSLMLGVTTAMTTDLPPAPMLWVAPLAIYLLTFVVAFRKSGAGSRWVAWTLPLAAAVMALSSDRSVGASHSLLVLIALHLLVFATVATGCHAELAAARPPAGGLTEFYLCLSVGGALGGLINAIVAPAVFNSVVEFPLALAAAAVAIPAARRALRREGSPWLLSVGGVSAAIVLLAAFAGTNGPRVLYQERSFFGVTRVIEGKNRNTHQLIHGTVEHGAQILGSGPQIAPLLYYHPDGPIGQVFQARMKARDASAVGVVGLGCGSLAYYWQKDQPFVFYEIDPVMIRIARNPELFTFLRDSKARCEIVPGDARLSLRREEDGRFGLLVIDAFSGDAIPAHLLTAEAVGLYRRKLAPGG